MSAIELTTKEFQYPLESNYQYYMIPYKVKPCNSILICECQIYASVCNDTNVQECVISVPGDAVRTLSH